MAETACLEWAKSIDNLLSDTEGLKLFRQFLAQECVTHPLDFYLACVGLRKSSASNQDLERLRLFLKSLYRKYLRKNSDSFVPLSDEIRRILECEINSISLSWSTAVEKAQEEVRSLLSNSLYQQFLKSDIYVQHLQKFFPQNDSNDLCNDGAPAATAQLLPTLHEDSEFASSDGGRKEKPRTKPPNPYFISYYTTVSTVDSERQSMGSDADFHSLTDSSM